MAKVILLPRDNMPNKPFLIERVTKTLGPEDFEGEFSKAFLEGIPAASRQDHSLGRKEHPFSFSMAAEFKHLNVHHSACIEAKVSATVGLGFHRETETEQVDVVMEETPAPGGPSSAPKPVKVTKAKVTQPKLDMRTGKPLLKRSKVSEACDDLCEISMQSLLMEFAEDYWNTGNAYIEVVDDDEGNILALYNCPSKDVYLVREDNLGHVHYEVTPSDGSGFTRVFAKFGDKDRLLKKKGKRLGGSVPIPDFSVNSGPKKRGRPAKGEVLQTRLTSLIHVPRPSSYSRNYGFPDWLAATLSIELVHCKHRHLYDFFLNRGVPEVIIEVTGVDVDEEDWSNFQKQLKNTIGLGNQHKTMSFHFPSVGESGAPAIHVHRLAMEGVTEGLFNELSDILAMEIVSAHGVPPLLAGIQIPGKLGASNELANALMAFQALRIQPAQEVIETLLWRTLGHQIPGTNQEDWKLRTILEELDLAQISTIGAMRQPVSEAKAQGRDLKAGVKQ